MSQKIGLFITTAVRASNPTLAVCCLSPAYWWFLTWLSLRPWRWRRYVPPKLRWIPTELHGVKTQPILLVSCSSLKITDAVTRYINVTWRTDGRLQRTWQEPNIFKERVESHISVVKSSRERRTFILRARSDSRDASSLTPFKFRHHKHHVAMETEAPTGHTFKASYFAGAHLSELGVQETAFSVWSLMFHVDSI
jgi:hypothetical protein